MTAEAFAHPFEYWVGMDTDPRTTPEALAEFDRFYSTTHVHEVIAAHSGFVGVNRYELVEPDPRGGEHRGPRWLAVYEMADEAAALQYLKDNARPWLHRKQYSPWPSARRRAKTVWRMLWRQVASTGSPDGPPDAVFLVGLNGPADTELGPVQPATYARGTRFELYREFAHPEPGCPRFCDIFESNAAETPETPEAPAIDGQDPVWRLRYRRIPPP